MKNQYKSILFMTIAVIAGTIPATAEFVSAKSGLCVRSQPTTDSERIDVLPYGTEVSGTIRAGWIKVENGYICTDYLQDEDPADGWQYMGEWHCTAYAETGYCCANGEYPEVGYTIACNSLPFGTEVYIENVGFRVVEDRGPASMGSAWLDVYLGIHSECVAFGSQYLEVWVTKMP